MKLSVRKRLTEQSIIDIELPYYYKIISKGNYLFGCLTMDHHYIVRMISGAGLIRYETECVSLEGSPVEIGTAPYETFSPSTESEFGSALSEVIHATKTVFDALNIKR